jgi:hypothetical protein
MLKWSDFWDFESTCFETNSSMWCIWRHYLQTCNARLGKLLIELAHQGHTRAYVDITHLEFKLFKTLQKPLNFINIF